MRESLVSIIVPVYNVERYISQCVDSIINQTYRNLEIILVDDGSPDNCPIICDEYQKMDSRIKVVHKKNGGLSEARNTGLDMMSGDYVCFVDSDDWIKPDYIEKLLIAIESNNVDIAFCGIDGKEYPPLKPQNANRKILNSTEAWTWLEDMISTEYVYMVVACNKIYRSKLWKNIRYPIGMLHEDEFAITDILSKSRKLTFIPDVLYYYRVNEDGITGNNNKYDLRHLNVIDAYEDRINKLISLENVEIAEITFRNGLYKMICWYKQARGADATEYKKSIFEKYRSFYTNNKRIATIRRRIKYRIFIIWPGLFIKIMS